MNSLSRDLFVVIHVWAKITGNELWYSGSRRRGKRGPVRGAGDLSEAIVRRLGGLRLRFRLARRANILRRLVRGRDKEGSRFSQPKTVGEGEAIVAGQGHYDNL